MSSAARLLYVGKGFSKYYTFAMIFFIHEYMHTLLTVVYSRILHDKELLYVLLQSEHLGDFYERQRRMTEMPDLLRLVYLTANAYDISNVNAVKISINDVLFLF